MSSLRGWQLLHSCAGNPDALNTYRCQPACGLGAALTSAPPYAALCTLESELCQCTSVGAPTALKWTKVHMLCSLKCAKSSIGRSTCQCSAKPTSQLAPLGIQSTWVTDVISLSVCMHMHLGKAMASAGRIRKLDMLLPTVCHKVVSAYPGAANPCVLRHLTDLLKVMICCSIQWLHANHAAP